MSLQWFFFCSIYRHDTATWKVEKAKAVVSLVDSNGQNKRWTSPGDTVMSPARVRMPGPRRRTQADPSVSSVCACENHVLASMKV